MSGILLKDGEMSGEKSCHGKVVKNCLSLVAYLRSLKHKNYTGWPKKVSHYQVSSSNRVKNRH